MTKLSVHVTVSGRNPATHHLITGFVMLERAGVVDLSLEFRPDLAPDHPSPSLVDAVVAGSIKIAYDVEDGYIVDWSTRNKYLETVQLCFKRSYNERCHASSPFASQFRPLGLIYGVTAKHPFLRRQRMTPRAYAKSLVQRTLGRQVVPYWWRFEDVPRRTKRPLIVFAAQAWDPRGEKGEYIGNYDVARADREPLNEMRAECVRRLRKEFGSSFVGGLVATSYARERFPDCVIDTSLTNKRAFMELVKRSDICIATRGLFGSNGYKLGEYVAASKAIVSERLKYSVPGRFVDGRNYVGFDDPESCVERTATLFSSPAAIYAMQVENYRYYHRYVRPDQMVLNTLMVALEEAEPVMFEPPNTHVPIKGLMGAEPPIDVTRPPPR